MRNSQQRQKHPHLLLNLVIIVLETFFSFVLNQDAHLHLQAQKLIERQATIRINSYIPFFSFYIQFTEKGLLFDLEAHDRTIDLEINCTLINLIKIFVFNKVTNITNLRISGDAFLTEQFTDLIPFLVIPKILMNWKQWLHLLSQDKVTASQQHIASLLEKIDQQRNDIDQLQTEIDQYQHHIQQLKKYQRLLIIACIILILICVILLYI